MRFVARIVAGLLGGLAAAPAMAQSLDSGTSYGNEAGCKVGRGETVETDDFLLLWSKGISAYASGCEFIQTLKSEHGTIVVTGLCDEEGQEGKNVSMFSITQSLKDPVALEVYDDDGNLWGEVKPCP